MKAKKITLIVLLTMLLCAFTPILSNAAVTTNVNHFYAHGSMLPLQVSDVMRVRGEVSPILAIEDYCPNNDEFTAGVEADFFVSTESGQITVEVTGWYRGYQLNSMTDEWQKQYTIGLCIYGHEGRVLKYQNFNVPAGKYDYEIAVVNNVITCKWIQWNGWIEQEVSYVHDSNIVAFTYAGLYTEVWDYGNEEKFYFYGTSTITEVYANGTWITGTKALRWYEGCSAMIIEDDGLIVTCARMWDDACWHKSDVIVGYFDDARTRARFTK